MTGNEIYGVYTDGKTPDHQFTYKRYPEESLKKYSHIKELFVGTKNECVLFRQNEYSKYKLTKAKEIIRYLCKMVKELSKPNPQFFNVEYSLQEAEQFLKESE